MNSLFKKIKEYYNKPIIKDIVDIALSFFIAFLLYKTIAFLLQTPYPLLSVVSCSMVPTLHKGDIIIVKGVSWEDIHAYNEWKNPNATIVVYYEPYQNKLIVHRVYTKYENNKSIVTWGDNNDFPDPWPVYYNQVKGEVIGHIPYIGYLRIWLGTLIGQKPDTEGC